MSVSCDAGLVYGIVLPYGMNFEAAESILANTDPNVSKILEVDTIGNHFSGDIHTVVYVRESKKEIESWYRCETDGFHIPEKWDIALGVFKGHALVSLKSSWILYLSIV